MSDAKNFEVITAAAERLSVSPQAKLPDLVGGAKDRIVGETFAPGRTCRRSRTLTGSIHRSCLRGYARRWTRDGRAALWGEGQAVKSAWFDAVTSDIAEIVIGDVVVHVGGNVAYAEKANSSLPTLHLRRKDLPDNFVANCAFLPLSLNARAKASGLPAISRDTRTNSC
jgi:hypothetical protein